MQTETGRQTAGTTNTYAWVLIAIFIVGVAGWLMKMR